MIGATGDRGYDQRARKQDRQLVHVDAPMQEKDSTVIVALVTP
jgi:hypothetical protein